MPSTQSVSISDRINTLLPKLQIAALKIGGASEYEDVYQSMIVSLIDRADEAPEFAQQSDAYLMQFATWRGQNLGVTYRKHIQEDCIFSNDEDDETTSLVEMSAITLTTPEDLLVEDETAVELLDLVASLTPENQKIVKMLYAGYSKTEIAASMGISKPAVSQRVATIGKQFSSFTL